jgi:ABC-type iron transport system FetAB permease component
MKYFLHIINNELLISVPSINLRLNQINRRNEMEGAVSVGAVRSQSQHKRAGEAFRTEIISQSGTGLNRLEGTTL